MSSILNYLWSYFTNKDNDDIKIYKIKLNQLLDKIVNYDILSSMFCPLSGKILDSDKILVQLDGAELLKPKSCKFHCYPRYKLIQDLNLALQIHVNDNVYMISKHNLYNVYVDIKRSSGKISRGYIKEGTPLLFNENQNEGIPSIKVYFKDDDNYEYHKWVPLINPKDKSGLMDLNPKLYNNKLNIRLYKGSGAFNSEIELWKQKVCTQLDRIEMKYSFEYIC